MWPWWMKLKVNWLKICSTGVTWINCLKLQGLILCLPIQDIFHFLIWEEYHKIAKLLQEKFENVKIPFKVSNLRSNSIVNNKEHWETESMNTLPWLNYHHFGTHFKLRYHSFNNSNCKIVHSVNNRGFNWTWNLWKYETL